MKKKPILLKKIKLEKELLKQEKLQEAKLIAQKIDRERKAMNLKTDKKTEKPIKVKENKQKEKTIVTTSHKKETKGFFGFLYGIIITLINLIISIIESLQWVFLSIVGTVALIIIIKYFDIDLNNYFDLILEKIGSLK